MMNPDKWMTIAITYYLSVRGTVVVDDRVRHDMFWILQRENDDGNILYTTVCIFQELVAIE